MKSVLKAKAYCSDSEAAQPERRDIGAGRVQESRRRMHPAPLMRPSAQHTFPQPCRCGGLWQCFRLEKSS